MNESFDLTHPDNFVAGTIGEPGSRIFYIQASQDGETVTLKVEKGQIQALASYLAEVLEDLAAEDSEIAEAPPERPTPMAEPLVAVWTVGGLAIGVEQSSKALVVMAEELPDNEDDEPAHAHFHLNPGQARGYIDQALFLIEYGRDFGRQNGHRRLDE
jgi:uncharacterized repeat protein (TIGR03847 family)